MASVCYLVASIYYCGASVNDPVASVYYKTGAMPTTEYHMTSEVCQHDVI